MALINCPECNREISDTVKSCPHCGFELKPKQTNEPVNNTVNKPNGIKCPQCGSTNISITQEQDLSVKNRGCIGWLMWIILACCTCGLALIIPLMTNSKVKSTTKTVCICQDCGRKWYK